MLRLNAIPPHARTLFVLAAVLLLSPGPALAQAKVVQTPYQNPKALVDIFLDDRPSSAPRSTGYAAS